MRRAWLFFYCQMHRLLHIRSYRSLFSQGIEPWGNRLFQQPTEAALPFEYALVSSFLPMLFEPRCFFHHRLNHPVPAPGAGILIPSETAALFHHRMTQQIPRQYPLLLIGCFRYLYALSSEVSLYPDDSPESQIPVHLPDHSLSCHLPAVPHSENILRLPSDYRMPQYGSVPADQRLSMKNHIPVFSSVSMYPHHNMQLQKPVSALSHCSLLFQLTAASEVLYHLPLSPHTAQAILPLPSQCLMLLSKSEE